MITKDMTIGEVVSADQSKAQVLMSFGNGMCLDVHQLKLKL